MERDFSFNSGERQVGKTLAEIRRDHLARYELAAQWLRDRKHQLGLDCFTGNGYGSYYLTKNLHEAFVLGIDASEEAIKFANVHYSGSCNYYANKVWPFNLPKDSFDFVVSLESIEHIKDGENFIHAMCNSLKNSGVLICSVPNENINSLKINKHKFHVKHYTPSELPSIMSENGMRLLSMYGQDVYHFRNGIQSELLDSAEMELKKNYDGQFLVYIFEKNSSWFKRFW